MANIKINGLVPAAVSTTMQLETDIGGLTANKITITGMKTFFDANLNFSPVAHTHTELNGGQTF